MKKRYIVLLAVVVIIVISIFVFRSFVRQAEEGLDQLSSLTIDTPDLQSIPDGTYEGSYEAFPVKVVAQVQIQNQKIANVELLEHRNGQGKPAEALTSRIVEQQSVELDVVSGATYSSMVILKAVELALTQ